MAENGQQHSPHGQGAQGLQDVNQTAEFFLSNYRLGKTLGGCRHCGASEAGAARTVLHALPGPCT